MEVKKNMTLFYEFGGNDDVPGEEYEYEISRWEAIRLFFKAVFGYDNWRKVFDFVEDLDRKSTRLNSSHL